MRWGNFFAGFFAIVIACLLLVYFFVPFGEVDLSLSDSGPQNYNFSLTEYSKMQFYDNMRYPSRNISYRIYDCPLQKKSKMEEAFEILENKTILDFYDVEYGEEISVTCDDENIVEEGLFIAGEGGPTNITIAGEFNVIYSGKILLIRESDCPTPNVALHELLHALGFDHSENKNNIMYEVSSCKQTIGEDIPDLINELYSVREKPDLIFENSTINLHGKYLDANLSIRNNGLKYSPPATIVVYVDDKNVKEVDLVAMDVGYGRKISLTNIWISKISFDSVRFYIDGDFEELDKKNNEIVFN